MGTAVTTGGRLLLLTAASLPWLTDACMTTAWSNGLLSASEQLESVSISPSGSGSCTCCAICHQMPACASLSFSVASSECRLYGSVASYASMTPDADWQYFVMPNRSQHEQFCRRNSDCLAAGDRCRGRVCTQLEAITCRVIHDTLVAGDRYGEYVRKMHGWLNNRPLALACLMGEYYGGATRLLKNIKGTRFDEKTVLDYNSELADEVGSHSILHLAEDIRQLGSDSTYWFEIWASSDHYFTFEAPRNTPMLSASQCPGVGEIHRSGNSVWEAVMPYLPTSGNILLSINGGDPDSVIGAVVRRDGDPSNWLGYNAAGMYVYIRE